MPSTSAGALQASRRPWFEPRDPIVYFMGQTSGPNPLPPRITSPEKRLACQGTNSALFCEFLKMNVQRYTSTIVASEVCSLAFTEFIISSHQVSAEVVGQGGGFTGTTTAAQQKVTISSCTGTVLICCLIYPKIASNHFFFFHHGNISLFCEDLSRLSRAFNVR